MSVGIHDRSGLERARAKLERKALDAIVFNDISRADIGFDTDENEVTILAPAGERAVGFAGKAEVAATILGFAQELRAANETSAPVAPKEAKAK